MSAPAQATLAPIYLNAGLMVFLDEAAATVRPRVQLSGHGDHRHKIRLHNAADAASRSATVSEIQQSVAAAYEQADVTISRGVDIYCVATGGKPEPFEWFRGILRDALRPMSEVCVRLHCFGALSENQSEVENWKSRLSLFGEFGGGAYLLSSCFRGTRLDRLRSYAPLARLAEVFAFTGKSRFAPLDCFTLRRENSSFHVYVAGLESYAALSHSASAEWLLDTLLWRYLLGSLPLSVAPELKTDPETAEHWLLQAAANSSSLDEMADRLQLFSMRRPWVAEVALRLQSAMSNAERKQPVPRLPHAFERTLLPFDNPDVFDAARDAVGAMLRVFPFPVHPFFLNPPPRAAEFRNISQARARQIDSLAETIRQWFRRESLRHHREWFPPNTSRNLAHAVEAFDVRMPAKAVFASCHLDPAVERELREELCAGPERIDFLSLVQVL
jgi:hypothetical protein